MANATLKGKEIASGVLAKCSESELQEILRAAKVKAERNRTNTVVTDGKAVLRILDQMCERFEISTPDLSGSHVTVLESEEGKTYIRIQPTAGNRIGDYAMFVLRSVGFKGVGSGGAWRLIASVKAFAYLTSVREGTEPEQETEAEPEPVQMVPTQRGNRKERGAK